MENKPSYCVVLMSERMNVSKQIVFNYDICNILFYFQPQQQAARLKKDAYSCKSCFSLMNASSGHEVKTVKNKAYCDLQLFIMLESADSSKNDLKI